MDRKILERSSEIDRVLLQDSESEGDDSDADPNFEFESEHDTESEFELEEEEQEREVETEDGDMEERESGNTGESEHSLPYFLGKDKTTKWLKNPRNQNIRTRAHNIVSLHLPGSVRQAMEVENPLEAWSLFFNEPLIDLTVESTNTYINKVRPNYHNDPNLARPTSVVEIKAYFGLLYISGVLHGSKMNLREFWSTDGTGVEIFRAGMSYRRFRFLTRCIRFDDIETREVRKRQDNIAPIRELINIFVSNCRKYYSVSECATLDETLVPFRGRCRFRMYIPSKPKRYGIKVFTLACSKTYYVKNLEVYCGKQPDGPYNVSNKVRDVVDRLVSPIKGSNRNITVDNWFTSYESATELLKNSKLTIVGTLKKNKPQIPPCFLAKTGKEKYSSIFGFQDNMTLVSYVPNRNKCVLLLSTMHHNAEIDLSTGEQKKPSIINYYNSTKSGVDVVDAMCAEYTVARGTKRWPLCLFFSLMNMAALNAYVILKGNKIVEERRNFIKELGRLLLQPHMSSRAQQGRLPREIRTLAARLSGTQLPEKEAPQPGKRGRCYKCKDNKTKYFCQKCKVWLCLSHAEFQCENCNSN